MFPTLFENGWFAIRGYGLMIGVGVLLGALLVRRVALRQGFDLLAEKLESLVVLIAIGAFLGGKLFYVLFHWSDFKASWDEGVKVALTAGFVFYGSIVFCVPLVGWFLKRNGLPVLRTMDHLALGAPLAHAFGRIGCFLAGCCYGCRHDGALAVRFEEGIGLNHVPLHPVQLYEAAGLLLTTLVLWLAIRRPERPDGRVLGLYLLCYSILRFATEFVRGDGNPILLFGEEGFHVPGTRDPGLSLAQITSLVMFPAALWLLARTRRKGKTP